MNIEPSKILKMKISHRYIFDIFSHYSDSFIVDFENKKAWNEFDSSGIDKNSFFDDVNKYPIVNLFNNKVSDKKHPLKKENIERFFIDFNKLNICNELKKINEENSTGIDFVNNVYIIFYFKDSWKEFIINFEFPEMWEDFALILKRLVGFDVLNISFSKYLVNNLNYRINYNGIYDLKTKEKLVLEKFNFTFNIGVSAYLFRFSIDFLKNMLKIEDYHGIGEVREDFIMDKNIDENLSFKFKKLLEKHNVYLWITKDFWKYALLPKNYFVCDGHRWGITLTFAGDIVFLIGGHNEHPDNYLEFAEDVKKLFGQDFLKSEKCKSTFDRYLRD